MAQRIERTWSGETVVVIASGPSLTDADVGIVRRAHAAGRCRAIAVNDCFVKAPWADMLYAADGPWWKHHLGAPGFAGEKWTVCDRVAGTFGLTLIAGRAAPGLSLDPACVHFGGNSGFQAVNIAVLRGAAIVALLGFDHQASAGRKHWFGDHPGAMNRNSPYGDWVKHIDAAAPEFAASGVRLVNCSRDSAIQAVPRQPIGDLFGDPR